MIIDINGVPHYVRGGKLYPAGSTPPSVGVFTLVDTGAWCVYTMSHRG